MAEKIVTTDSSEATSAIFGTFDSNIRIIEEAFNVRIFNKNRDTDDGDVIDVSGDVENVERAVRTLEYLKLMSGAGEVISESSVEYVVGLVRDNGDEPIEIGRAHV